MPYWYLGSANCTDPAQGRNVEFMVELKASSTSGYRAKDVFKVLTDPNESEGITLFEPYDINSRVSTVDKRQMDLDVRKIKYDLSILPLVGSVEKIEGGTAYNLLIEIDATKLILPTGYAVKIRPLPEHNKAHVVLKIGELNTIKEFTGYSETALSPFLDLKFQKMAILAVVSYCL